VTKQPASQITTLKEAIRRNVRAGMRRTNQWVSDAETPNREFLFLIKK
jgi:adenine-specific DNA-methyltransferase